VASAQDLLSISLCLNGAFLGDIELAFMCPECQSLYEMHIQANVRDLDAIADVLLSDEPGDMVDKQELIRSGRNNSLTECVKIRKNDQRGV